MRSPVVVSRTSTASEADLLASHLRDQGIEATSRTFLDRTAYAGLGGATVLVPEEQRIEAELELMLLDEPAQDGDGMSADVASQVEPERRVPRTWVRVGSWVVLAGMVVMTIVPSASIIWRALGG